MADKSCKTCEYDYYNNCRYQNCEDCAMVNHDGGCICNDWYDGGKNCPHYKKYEPTSSANEISSSD